MSESEREDPKDKERRELFNRLKKAVNYTDHVGRDDDGPDPISLTTEILDEVKNNARRDALNEVAGIISRHEIECEDSGMHEAAGVLNLLDVEVGKLEPK